MKKLTVLLLLLNLTAYSQTAFMSKGGSEGGGGGDTDVIEFLQIVENICHYAYEKKLNDQFSYTSCMDFLEINKKQLENNNPHIIFTNDQKKVKENGTTEKQALYSQKDNKIVVLRSAWAKLPLHQKYSLVGIELSGMLGIHERYDFGLQIAQDWKNFKTYLEESGAYDENLDRLAYLATVELSLTSDIFADGVKRKVSKWTSLYRTKQITFEEFLWLLESELDLIDFFEIALEGLKRR